MQAEVQQIPRYPPIAGAPGSVAKHSSTTALVLSWEDVVAPMSFLSRRVGLQPTRSSLEAAKAAYLQDRYLQQALASVEEEAIELLRAAAMIGPVFVITDKSIRYMQTTCAAFLPRLQHWLASADQATATNGQHFRVHVVSAPQRFANIGESSAWLARMYQQIVKVAVCEAHCAASLTHSHQLLQCRESGAMGLVSVSAATAGVTASVKALEVAPFLTPKAVLVPGGDPTSALNLEHFFAQLRTLQGYIAVAAAHDGAFSMELEGGRN